MDHKQARNLLEQRKGQKDQTLKNLESVVCQLEEAKRQLHLHEMAREIIRQVGLKTQQQLQYHISEVTSLAMEAVFEDPYKLKVTFVERRNKAECDLQFERGGIEFDPLLDTAGGAVDIASFALRVASWSMEQPRQHPVLILDEPFKNLDANRLPRASEMLKQVSEQLNLQIIMVTHSDELIECADKVFRISLKNRVSHIEMKG